MTRLVVLLAALALVAGAAPAQITRLTTGYDQILDRAGGGVETWLPNGWDLVASTDGANVGLAARRRVFHSWELDLGDQSEFFMASGAAFNLPVRGVTLRRAGVAFFVGAGGALFSEPFVNTGYRFNSLAAGVTYTRRWRGWTLAGALARDAGKTTAIASVDYEARHWRAFATEGDFAGRPSLDYGGALSLWTLTASAERETYVNAGKTESVDSLGAGGRVAGFDASASWFASPFATGADYALARSLGPITARASYLAGGLQRIIDLAGSARIGERLTVSADAENNRSTGAWSTNLGGGFRTNPLTVSVGWAEQFTPLDARQPWTRSLVVAIALQLPRSIAAEFRTVTDPTGRTRLEADANAYVGDGAAGGSSAYVPRFARVVLTGKVVDQAGRPVEGVAIRVGNIVAFTDSDGIFTVRVAKDRPYPLVVDLQDSVAPGSWLCASCPATIDAQSIVRVVLRQL